MEENAFLVTVGHLQGTEQANGFEVSKRHLKGTTVEDVCQMSKDVQREQHWKLDLVFLMVDQKAPQKGMNLRQKTLN